MEGKEICDAIEAILIKGMTEQKGYEEGDILVEWALIGYVTNPDSEKKSAYPMVFSNGEMAGHRAKGLFLTALETLRFEEEDDE